MLNIRTRHETLKVKHYNREALLVSLKILLPTTGVTYKFLSFEYVTSNCKID